MKPNKSVWQVCDANLNRAREGLRVCEEAARFVLKEPGLTRRCQRLRYRLSTLSRFLPEGKLLAARDARGDVGCPQERISLSHRGMKALVKANARRTQEALRVLEEFTRLSSVPGALGLARLRFEVYSLEQALLSELPPLRHR